MVIKFIFHIIYFHIGQFNKYIPQINDFL